MFYKIKRAFTLVELLVVMGVLAILAAGLIALISPVERVNQANDTKVLADLSQLTSALQAFAASNSGLYPCTAVAGCTVTGQTQAGLGALVPVELTVVPTAPTNYVTYTLVTNSASAATRFKVYGQVKSTKNGATSGTTRYVVYCSATGTVGYVNTTAPTDSATCP